MDKKEQLEQYNKENHEQCKQLREKNNEIVHKMIFWMLSLFIAASVYIVDHLKTWWLVLIYIFYVLCVLVVAICTLLSAYYAVGELTKLLTDIRDWRKVDMNIFQKKSQCLHNISIVSSLFSFILLIIIFIGVAMCNNINEDNNVVEAQKNEGFSICTESYSYIKTYLPEDLLDYEPEEESDE